jgi:mannose-6-phosphate isomerase-like protein (cupin superfamily)
VPAIGGGVVRRPAAMIARMSYELARLDEIEEITDGRCPFRPVRHHFGIASFGVNVWTGQAVGDRIINEHDEADEHEELYLVLGGRAVFELDGERRDAPRGTFVYVEPGVVRTAFAEEPGTSILALGGMPGKAYQAGGFELWAPVAPLYAAGQYAEAADRLREVAEAHPQYSELLYNLACCESLAGRPDDAIRHLRQAFEASGAHAAEVRELAEGDTDLDGIRELPAFRQLVAD